MRLGPGPSLVLLIGASALYPSTAHGQSPRVELDVRASRIEYDTLGALNAPSVSLLSEWQRTSWFSRISTSATGFEGAGWSAQGSASLAGWRAPLGEANPFRLELGGSASASRHSAGYHTSLGQLDGRLHVIGQGVGGWVGTSVAAAKNSLDPEAVGAVTPSAGVWMQGGSVRGMVSYQHTRISGQAHPEVDAVLNLSRGRLDLGVFAGVREWPLDVGPLDEVWAGVTAAYWVTSRAALVVSGGKYASDVLQGLPGGQFVSLGIRVTPRRVRPVPIAAVAPIVYTIEQAATGGIGFDIDGVRRVDIAGDWNGWQPVAMTRSASGLWTLPAGLEPGTYRFNLLVDGERWMVPEGVPTIPDGFGGEVGLLIVSAGEM